MPILHNHGKLYSRYFGKVCLDLHQVRQFCNEQPRYNWISKCKQYGFLLLNTLVNVSETGATAAFSPKLNDNSKRYDATEFNIYFNEVQEVISDNKMSSVNVDLIVKDPMIDVFMNCSVRDSVHNLTVADVVRPSVADVAMVFEIVLRTVTILLVFIILHIETWKLRYRVNKQTCYRVAGLLVLASLVHIVALLLIAAFAYKMLCKDLIKEKDKQFIKYLDSFDVFWCLENDASKSIINVLGLIESNSAEHLVIKIREKLLNLPINLTNEKMFYTRSEMYGFYYWQRHNISAIDLKDYVDIVNVNYDKTKLDNNDLEELLTKVSKRAMPCNDKGLFQILVTKYRVNQYDDEKGDYGIIFRVHHSVGDGLALIEFLCKTLTDKYQKSTLVFPAAKTKNNEIRYTSRNLVKMMKTLLKMPVCLIDGILRRPDQNSLHGPELLGENVFKWTQNNENLLSKIKEIKSITNKYNFSEILTMALSNGLRRYFLKTMKIIPEETAVVVPVRFQTSFSSELENNFSVTILDLPTRETNIKVVSQRCQDLRTSADPLTNYYFLKSVSSTLPSFILKPLLNSSQATLVLSNMPGPPELTICGGDKLKSMVFFVPNKGTTGLGVTAFCYGGVLRFAAMADKALVSSSDELDIILRGMEDEIDRLHQLYVK